jgi:hypothetical protein
MATKAEVTQALLDEYYEEVNAATPDKEKVMFYAKAYNLLTSPNSGIVTNMNLNYVADTGAADAYAGSVNGMSNYAPGDMYLLNPANDSTGASTLNINAIGDKSIKKNGSDTASGDLKAGIISTLVYDGTNFQLIGGGASGSSTSSIASAFLFMS